MSSNEEILAPIAIDSTVFTGSTVFASFHALLEVGVQEFLPSVPTIFASSRAVEEGRGQVALIVAGPSPVDLSRLWSEAVITGEVPSDGHGCR